MGIAAKTAVAIDQPNIPPIDDATTDARSPSMGINQITRRILEYGFITGKFPNTTVSTAYHPAREYISRRIRRRVYPKYPPADEIVGLWVGSAVCSGGTSATGSSVFIVVIIM
jgi:hypothetical protein